MPAIALLEEVLGWSEYNPATEVRAARQTSATEVIELLKAIDAKIQPNDRFRPG